MQNTPMSPIGAALFDMIVDMGKSQARIYQEKGFTPESQAEAITAVEMTRIAHQPNINAAMKPK